jgi:tetratricopeptide (TPR) repeat protein
MSSITRLRLAALGLAFFASQPSRASDLAGFSITLSIVGGEKEPKDDHAREVVPARPDFALWDNGKTIKPQWVDTIYTIERAEQGRLLIKEYGKHAYRGWVASRDVVSLNQAESFFSAAIQADNRKAFPYLMRGTVRIHLKQTDRALADLDAALRLDPRCTAALDARADIHAFKDHRDLAFADINRAIEIEPSTSCLYYTRAGLNLQFHKENLDLALADIDRAIQLDPSDASYRLTRAVVNRERHKYKEASDDSRNAVKLRPQDPEIFLASVLIVAATGELREAREALTARLKEHPDRELAYKCYISLACLDSNRWNHSSSMSDLEQAIAINPAKEDAYLIRSSINSRRGLGRKAMDDLNTAVRVNPANAATYEGRASIWYDWREYAAALADMETAVRLAPENAQFHERLALVLATCPDPRIRKGKEAVALATRACELSEWKTPHFLDTLAAAYAEAGDFRSAIAYEQKAISMLPKFDWHEEEYRRSLGRYKESKPSYRLSLLEEWGFRTARRTSD